MEQGTGIEPVIIDRKILYFQCLQTSISIFISILLGYCEFRDIGWHHLMVSRSFNYYDFSTKKLLHKFQISYIMQVKRGCYGDNKTQRL